MKMVGIISAEVRGQKTRIRTEIIEMIMVSSGVEIKPHLLGYYNLPRPTP